MDAIGKPQSAHGYPASHSPQSLAHRMCRYGCLPHLERVLKEKGHAVVVVAEGAGEELIGAEVGTDAGGNKKLPEIGPFFKQAVSDYFAEKGTEVTIKYIDPRSGISHILRVQPHPIGRLRLPSS